MRSRDLFLSFGAFALLSLAYTYPLVESPASANRLDSPDALLNAWILSWNLYQIPRDPLHLFDANIFFPEKGALAYSENLVTASLLVGPAALFSGSPILLYNLALLAAFVTTGLATYLLAHDVTRSHVAAALAGILFAFAPFRFAHIPHLQLLLAFGVPLQLYFARRCLTQGRALPAAGLALSIPLTFGSSVYYSVYAATVLPVVAFFELRALETASRLRAAARLGAGIALGAAATLPLALPYWHKLSQGSVRSLEEASRYSAGLSEYVSSFSLLHPFLGKASEPLFPGFAALVLAGIAIGGGRRERPWCWVAVGALGIALSLGPFLGLFSFFYELLPPYRALRVPSRAGTLFLLAVALLAAVGLRRLRSKLLRGSLVAVAAAECFSGPLPLRVDAPELPAIYDRVAALEGEGALVELPLPAPERFQDNAIYVYRSIFHQRNLVNGYSGFVPESYREAFSLLMEGELDVGLAVMYRRGVRFVLAHEARLGPRMLRQILDTRQAGRLVLVAEAGPDRLYAIGAPSSSARLLLAGVLRLEEPAVLLERLSRGGGSARRCNVFGVGEHGRSRNEPLVDEVIPVELPLAPRFRFGPARSGDRMCHDRPPSLLSL